MAIRVFFVILCVMLSAPPAPAIAGGFCCQMPAGVYAGASGAAASGAGRFSVRADYSYSRMERFFDGDSGVELGEVLADPRFAKMGGVVPEAMDMHRVTLTASYAPASRLRFNLAVPYVINDMSMLMFMGGKWTRMRMDEVSGLGDVALTGMYTVYRDRDIMPAMTVSAGFGLKFPTGSYTETSKGKRVHAHMQPGTGSWDPSLSLAFVDMLNSDWLVQADASYTFTTVNPLGYGFGDTFSLNGHLNYNVLDYLNVSLGIGYFHSEQADDPENSYNGQVPGRVMDFVGYSGEDSVWITPGFQLLPLKGGSLDLKFDYPLYYHTGGIQQVTDYRLSVAVSYGF